MSCINSDVAECVSVYQWPTVCQWAHTKLDQHRLCLFQGMNFIAGYLIIITKDEEKSFWLMDALLGKMLPGSLRVFLCCLNVFSVTLIWLEVFIRLKLDTAMPGKWGRCQPSSVCTHPQSPEKEVKCKTPVSVNQGGAEPVIYQNFDVVWMCANKNRRKTRIQH